MMPPDDTDNRWFYEALKSGLAEATIERAERTGDGGTHWDECWRSADHRACALARIERMERQLGIAGDNVMEADMRWIAKRDYDHEIIRGLCRRLHYWRGLAGLTVSCGGLWSALPVGVRRKMVKGARESGRGSRRKGE